MIGNRHQTGRQAQRCEGNTRIAPVMARLSYDTSREELICFNPGVDGDDGRDDAWPMWILCSFICGGSTAVAGQSTAMAIHRIAPSYHYPSLSLTVLECYHVAPVRHCPCKPLEKFRWRPVPCVCLLFVSRIVHCRLARFEPALLFPVRVCRGDAPRTAATAAGATTAAPAASGSRGGALHGYAPLHMDEDSALIALFSHPKSDREAFLP